MNNTCTKIFTVKNCVNSINLITELTVEKKPLILKEMIYNTQIETYTYEN